LEGLRKHFGFATFGPGQKDVVDRLLAGQDVLAVMPTGSGKSLCYQLLAVLAASRCLETDPDSGLLGSKQGRDTPLDMSAMRLREKRDWDRLQAMLDYLTLGGCRRRLLGYFGEDWSEDRPCETCDGCTAPRQEESCRVVATGTAPRKSTAEIEAAARTLKKWLEENSPGPGDALFPSSRGGLLSADSVSHIVRVAVGTASAKCPSLATKRVTPHVFRHSTAMHLLQSGVDISVIALWLGHESIETTHIYVEADLATKERALDMLAPAGCNPPRFKPSDPLLTFLSRL
jgi:integrase